MRKYLLFACVLVFLSGCIRLTGRAGVWKKSAADETPTVHQVGFDTADIAKDKNS